MTVFLVEQNAYHALRLAHRGYVMVNGVITMTGTGRGAAGAAGGPRRLSRGRAALTAAGCRELRMLGELLRRRRQRAVDFLLVTVLIGGRAA